MAPENARSRPGMQPGGLEASLADGSASVTRGTDVAPADLLTLSDERDAWLRRLLDAERAAYRRGYADCHADYARRDNRAWAAMPALRVAVVPSHAELELSRYAHGHFGDVRPGDRVPRQERVA